jgi:2-dehydro-3-deoxy-D-gluconate 5-dehydrogenase
MAMFDLSGRVAVITGGNGGIGLGMAKGLAQAGATIVIGARNPEKNAAAVKELEALGARAMAIPTDVRDEKQCRALIDKAAQEFGRLDILVNNSGMNYRSPPESYTMDQWKEVMDVNLTSAFICSQAAYPHFVKAKGGKIINIGSMMTIFGSPFATAYAASKGGIVQMGRAMTCSWAKDNIQINSILPGWIDTDLTRAGRKEVAGLHERVLARTPAQRWGDPEDFAGIAVFLASKASDFVNGAAITVDGGYAVMG